MKILMIAPTPFMADRGCHTQILLEIKGLERLGHDVLLCTYGLGRDVEGVRTLRCPNLPWYRKLSAGPSYTKMLLLPILAWTTLSAIRRFRPNVVHAHLHEGALIALACRLAHPTLLYVFDMQGSLTGECLQHGFVREGSLACRLLQRIERVIVAALPAITQSESMIRELISLGAKQERIANVKDGVDTELFRPRSFDRELATRIGVEEQRPRVLFMGLLETYQGADLLFEALARVAREVPECQFLVIGYPNLDRYREKCRELGILGQTRFLGRIDYFTLPAYLSLAPIAVAPKIAVTEGDGKIYNYMAMGMCTIAFDRSVSREILGDTGLFAEMGSATDLASRIVWAVRHPEDSRRLGERARERAERELSWTAVGRRIDAAYKSLGRGPARRG